MLWHLSTLVLRTECQSAQMSNVKKLKDGLDQYGAERFATVRKSVRLKRLNSTVAN